MQERAILNFSSHPLVALPFVAAAVWGRCWRWCRSRAIAPGRRRTSRFSWHGTVFLQELLLSSSIAGERKINRHGVNFRYRCCGRSSGVTAGGLGGNPLMGVPVAVSTWGCSMWKCVPWGQTCLLGKAELPQLKAWIFREQRCWLLLINARRKQRRTPLDSCFGVSEHSLQVLFWQRRRFVLSSYGIHPVASTIWQQHLILKCGTWEVTHVAPSEAPVPGLGGGGWLRSHFSEPAAPEQGHSKPGLASWGCCCPPRTSQRASAWLLRHRDPHVT